jgi:hypothetical protein
MKGNGHQATKIVQIFDCCVEKVYTWEEDKFAKYHESNGLSKDASKKSSDTLI